MSRSETEPFIIAIDFGTAYSGYAYCMTPQNAEPVPHLRRWGQEQGQETPKTPTCILFDGNGKFKHFGYEAKHKYLEMEKEEATEHYFFENFKMELYNKRITNDFEIRDVNKKPMNALKVFSAALRFLKDDALKHVFIHTNGIRYIASDFTWVLTVPAIWDFSARMFMREAAVQAGIVTPFSGDKLVIALEPEAASVWCKKLPSDGFITDEHDRNALQQTPGTHYIVVDCGGGTIDITLHKVLEGGAVKELHKASGNDKGGQKVNKKFKQSMKEFFCDDLWEEYEKHFSTEVQRFVYDFEIVKQGQGEARLNCYYNLAGLIEQNQSKNKELFNDVKGLSWNKGKIIISKDKMEFFYHESLVHITESLYELLNRHSDVKYILLVGGFAQSRVLCDHIKKEFSDQATVLCPKNPQDAILRGAVMFGRDQSVIRTRKSAFTYGLSVSNRFDASKHKEEKRFTNKEGDWCKDIFSKLVGKDEDVGWNETKEYTFGPIERDQKSMKLSFYRTERKHVSYVDEWGMEGPVASCVVEMPDVKKGMNRTVKLEVFFGSTEMKAKATDVESGSTASVKIDFIRNQ
ncbi:hypothetical protein WMY93_033536 [Mugilogobius chulae]|uniref:Heat shock 70 kDa protein 12A n=1 Tax=Mugilogobius chulae TaxID=88201 RepID=A0AAW0MT19_9GOBI